MLTCNFNNTITERDMDLLLAEAASTDADFFKLIIDKTDLKGKPFKTIKVEVSKSDADGESDVTLVVEVDGNTYGFLIEDKVDAPAMPDQHSRYLKRGDTGVKKGEFDDYRVFIFCPDKYRQNNSEAKLYEHFLTYEECREYFKGKADTLSLYRAQQLSQAISKAKRPASVTLDKDANAFFRKYCQYQEENYPSLVRVTKETSNGWWPHYNTNLNGVYIHHKMPDGTVDLTFPKAADKLEDLRRVAEWARYHGIPDAIVAKRAKAASIRIKVPPFDMRSSFDDVSRKDLEKCFDAIQQLTDLANIIALTYAISDI